GTTNYRDGFVTKLGADGSYGWTAVYGSVSDDAVRGLAITPSGDVVVSGCFRFAIDLDPGPATHMVTPTYSASTAEGWTFVTRLTPAGNFVWAYTAQQGGCALVAAAPDGSIYAGSSFSFRVDFDPFGTHNEILTHARLNDGTTDVWVGKLSAGGTYLWS